MVLAAEWSQLRWPHWTPVAMLYHPDTDLVMGTLVTARVIVTVQRPETTGSWTILPLAAALYNTHQVDKSSILPSS